MQHDRTHFCDPVLDMGCIAAGEERNFRVVIRNRSNREVGIDINCDEFDFGSWQYSLKPLASGIARVIDVNVAGKSHITKMEEAFGNIMIRTWVKKPERFRYIPDESHSVPVYVKFIPPAG